MNRKIILIVDDEPDLLEILQFTLEDEGYRTLTAPSSQEALELMRRERVDLMLTDVRMPGGDGLSLMTECRRLHPELVVVLMTGFADVDTEEAQTMGAVALLHKPFDPGQLLDTLRRHLNG